MLRSTSGTTRVVLVLFALLLSVVFVLPTQSRLLLEKVGQPLTEVVTVPIRALAAVDRSLRATWGDYIALREVVEDNKALREEVLRLRRENSELRESAASSRRLEELLGFQQSAAFRTIAAQVIGRDASNWYRGLLVNKGEQDGVAVEMGVITPAGAIGRVVKTSAHTAMVLLATDPHNAITGVIQRTRDEGILEGTSHGRLRMKYLPLLSPIQVGDYVVTSGLTGGFPKGLAIGTITRVDKTEGDLFQSAEILPEADFSRLEEVLVVAAPGLDPPQAEQP